MRDFVKKLKFKDVASVVNFPENFKDEFNTANFAAFSEENSMNTNVLVFVRDKEEFLNFIKSKLVYVQYDAVLWFAYPKGNSKIKTDINRDILWQFALDFELRPVSAIAIDTTWSALRFRPIACVGK